MMIKTTQCHIIELWKSLQSKPIKRQSQILSLLLCSLFFVYSIIYCQFYVSYVVQIRSEITESVLWALRKYGFWFVVIPYLLTAYSNLWRSKKHYLFCLYLASILAGTAYGVAIDLNLNASTFAMASVINFIPTHLTAGTLVMLCWATLMRPNPSGVQTDTYEKEDCLIDSSGADKSNLLRVHTGTQERDIAVSEIECISAAGNYMEVHSGEQVYIVRATIKDLEEQLRPQQFIRIHRSHLINSAAILSIHDNQSIVLKNGRSLPISQRYQSNFLKKQYLV